MAFLNVQTSHVWHKQQQPLLQKKPEQHEQQQLLRLQHSAPSIDLDSQNKERRVCHVIYNDQTIRKPILRSKSDVGQLKFAADSAATRYND